MIAALIFCVNLYGHKIFTDIFNGKFILRGWGCQMRSWALKVSSETSWSKRFLFIIYVRCTIFLNVIFFCNLYLYNHAIWRVDCCRIKWVYQEWKTFVERYLNYYVSSLLSFTLGDSQSTITRSSLTGARPPSPWASLSWLDVQNPMRSHL